MKKPASKAPEWQERFFKQLVEEELEEQAGQSAGRGRKSPPRVEYPEDPSDPLNIKQAAQKLGVSVSGVKRLMKNKQITCHKVRGSLRFTPRDIDEYRKKRTLHAR